MKKNLGLVQICRGLAAMLVVLCHISGSTQTFFKTSFLGDFFLQGYIGVDFFFVLSGFIITYIHFTDIVNSSNKIAFLKKRFVRIYPFYWIILSVYVFLLFLAHGKTTHLDHVINFHSVNDWAFIMGSYLLIPMKSNPLLGVSWSLTYEIIFYIAFVIFISLGLKKTKYVVIAWTILILLKIVLSCFYKIPEIILLNERIIEFLAGCLVAYLILNSYSLNRRTWIILSSVSVVLLYIIYPAMLLKPVGILVLAFVMGLVVYKIVSIDISKDNKYPKLFLLIGDASYSIYLSHLIFVSTLLRAFLIFINKFQITNFIELQFLILILFLLIITGGVLIFLFIEYPLLRLLNRKPHRNKKEIRFSSTML